MNLAAERSSGLSLERRPMAIAQTLALARRSAVGTLRQPSMWFPALIFPLLIAAINSAAMGRSTSLPGFPPVDSFLQFLLPATLIQGVMFGGVMGGADVALDIENGFFERLVASPVSRPAILVGRLAGSALLGGLQAIVFIVVFTIFGAHIDGGIVAVGVLVFMGMVLALAIGGWAAAMALRTGSQEAVQNSFPLIFILLFISSAFFPTDLMTGWFKAVATYNPLTYLIGGARELVIEDFSLAAAAQAIGVAAGLAVLSVAFATAQFRRRLGETA
jgi:ABC-2 type transport system permease protein